ncbi:tannase/feruloyl esterase family alpha/beta hydrolase [Duganella radicis]|uniref:Tannase/feruloyl esterase family alpha/beta hydrolase n=2 Tax=Duganella radicis TaxID=551988 RepID=A0A6L6PD91_9BURK|nr:tannase/feruloyl esterase family alpha/beta hydrolase [Duganella radicis]
MYSQLAARVLRHLRACWTLAALLLGLSWVAPAHSQAAPADAAEANCNNFQSRALKFSERSVRLVSSRFVAAGPLVFPPNPGGPGRTVSLPDHCEVFGVLQERTGVRGAKYAIRFHMRLPVAWNQRFFFQGGGGSNGEVGDAVGQVGPSLPPALALGYAVLTQDSGHDNATNTDPAYNGPLAFGFDPLARSNYGDLSLKLTAQTGKEVLAQYYGQKPRYSFFVGCSKGGQEGMVFAQRYPEEFDGIVAAAPGFSLPRAALAEAWDTQVFGELVKAPGATGFDVSRLHQAFSVGDYGLVRNAILAACDKDDGLEDGIVGDFTRCTDDKVLPQLRARLCQQDKAEGCLSSAQIAALQRSRQGPRDAKGRALYSDWGWAPGISDPGWRLWKTGFPNMTALNVTLGARSLASVFTTPPSVLPDGDQAAADFQSAFDFDRDAARIYAVNAVFKRSGWQDVGARSPDLSAFQRRGGRLIVPHGDSDAVFSLNDTLSWYREVDARAKGKAASFVRVFPVPGMCHCMGGPATDNYDAFGALVAWVESGKAPDQIIATAGPASPWPGRERPLCAYPQVARYTGRGDPEKAASFECRI